MHIIGLDIGTTSICGICCNVDTGEIVEVITLPNDAGVAGSHTWEKLQDAHTIIATVEKITDRLIADKKDVCGIGITGQMHGIVYLNEKGEIVSPLYTWQDGRGDRLYKDGKSYAKWLSEQTGYSLATGYGAVTHFYNTVNGLVPDSAKTFCTIHDLAAMMLANEVQPVLHPSDAASFGLYNLHMDQFDIQAITSVGMNAELFPKVKTGYPMIGQTTHGIPVAVAIGDNQASVIGSVNDLENSILINVGTGSQISCIVKGIPDECGMDCRPLTDELYLLAGSSLCGGRAYAILEKFLRDTVIQITGQGIASVYSAMSKVMAEYDKPEQPLVIETTFSGTRQEPEKKGIISNIDINNLTMANLCDGFMNGMVEELYQMYQEMKPFMDSTPNKMVGSGNGIRLNEYLAQRFADKFEIPLRIPAHKEEAAFGAALFGLVVAKSLPNMKEIHNLIKYN